jgi:hypothetical protein
MRLSYLGARVMNRTWGPAPQRIYTFGQPYPSPEMEVTKIILTKV